LSVIPKSGTVEKHLMINVATFKVYLAQQVGVDDNDIEQVAKKRRTSKKVDLSEKSLDNLYYSEVAKQLEPVQNILRTIFSKFVNHQQAIIEITFKKLMNDFKCFDSLDIISSYPSIIKGFNRFFDKVKQEYPGTVPTKINVVKKSIKSTIEQYSQLKGGQLKRIFPSVKWKRDDMEVHNDNTDDVDVINNNISDDNDSDSNDNDSGSDDNDNEQSQPSDSEPESEDDDVILKVTSAAFSTRKRRRDFVDITAASDFWHDMSNIDTNNHGNYCVVCKKGDDVIADYHPRRVQVYTTDNLHEMFLQSQEYKDHYENTEQNIGLSLFKRAKCPCIKNDRMRSCADVVKVGMNYALKALKAVLENNSISCQCRFCLNDRSELKLIFKSEKSLLQYLLCPEVIHEEVRRESVDNKIREDIAKSNIENAKIKYDPSAKAHSSFIPGKSIPSFQQEKYVNYSFKCSHFECDECGLEKLDNFDACELLNSEILEGNIWEYSKELKTNSDDKDGRGLTKAKKSYKNIFTDFKSLVSKYIPHVWQTRNDDFMRKQLLESGIDMNTAVIHTDFSAVLPLLSQNSECCHHPTNSLQDVFVVSYKQENELINKAYHCWGSPNKTEGSKLKSNTAYHNACLRHIIQELKDSIFGEDRPLKVIYVLSDGCAGQYKNISNLF
jgi:hypothetical protein